MRKRPMDRRSGMRLFIALTLAVLSALARVRAQVPGEDEAPPREPAPRAIGDLLRDLGEPPPDEEPMGREVRANFIDKVRIAEEREQRIVGLGELGNPHMPPGVLLQRSARDPERSQVDAAAHRERLIRLVERDADIPSGRGEGMGAGESAQPAAAGPADSSPSATRKALAWICAALAAGSLALLAFLLARRGG